MDWNDLASVRGTEIDGHRVEEAIDARTARTLRLSDRRSGRLHVLDLDPALEAELRAGIDTTPARGVLPVLGSGVLDADHGYIVTADVEAPTLDDLLEEGPLEASRATRILMGLAEALASLHARGLSLLDLRPTDVLVQASWDGDGVLVPPHPSLVGPPSGRSLGGYCAPDAEFDPDERADQFTLGVLGFELLTGATPHNPDAPPGERTLLPIGSIDGAPEALSSLVTRLLRDEPSGRFPSMAAVVAALHALESGAEPSTYGHFTPAIPHQRSYRPTGSLDVAPEPEIDELEGEADSILGFLLLLVVAWAVAMGLSVAVFWLW
ncbi:MAG: hypothetical protein KC656_01860 [Myxococcales bacterium]|nr:hypothetical protein [Myxococcales bacterium]